MIADGADFGGLFANDDVAAVGALPNGIAVTGEDQAAFDVGQELLVALFVLFLNLTHHTELGGNFLEAFFFGFLGHTGVHVGPLVVLAFGCVFQVLHGTGHCAIVKVLEPDLSVLFLVGSGFFKDGGYLHKAVFLSLGGVVGILVTGHGFAGEGFHEVLFGLCSFEIHNAFVFSVIVYCTCLRNTFGSRRR